MDLNISKQKAQTFGANTGADAVKKAAKVYTATAAAVTGGAAGISVNELTGRTLVKKTDNNYNFFNQEVSYNHFKNGKLKDISEYIIVGQKCIKNLSDFDYGNKLNTLCYQEMLVNKILNESVLKENKNIRDNLFGLITHDNNWSLSDSNNEFLLNFVERQTDSRLKILSEFTDNEDLQKNPEINNRIGNLVRCVHTKEQAELLIYLLKSNANNIDKDFFSNLESLLTNNISPELIKKVLNNKLLYDNIDSFVLYNIDGTSEASAEKINQVLDLYLEKYSQSEMVTQKLRKILIQTFNYSQKEEPLTYAEKLMQKIQKKENQTKYETAEAFCTRIETSLKNILSGKEHNSDISTVGNVNNYVSEIRKLRTEIKNNCQKYDDEISKEKLIVTLSKIVSSLDEMKELRTAMGFSVIGLADVTDETENKNILAMLN